MSEQERKKYDLLWSHFPEYRMESPADYLTPAFLSQFKSQIRRGDSVLDFGCGPGRSAPHLLKAGLRVCLVDISENCLDPDIFFETLRSNPSLTFHQRSLWNLTSDVQPADWILCFDVLEHLPEEKIESSLNEMAERMKSGGLFSVACCEDGFGKMIGETLHLTVKSSIWWKKEMQKYFSVTADFLIDEKWYVLKIEPLKKIRAKSAI